jgi:shikimate dehydrogenase
LIAASTRVVGIIGDPVAHSRSPAIHNAAFAELDLDYVFVAFPVRPGGGIDAVRAVHVLGLAGLSVTMPHKHDAARACDELTPAAAALGAVNAVARREDGTLLGASTDGDGFVRALADEGVTPGGRRVLVLGAGGAARAVVRALGEQDASVAVAARRAGAARAAAALAPEGRPVALPDVEAWVPEAEIIVNATPLGMGGEQPPFPTELLHDGQLVVDTVYHPAETPLLAQARARGARATNGLGMLVHQAALAFELWTGRPAPLPVMRRAAGE